MSVLKIVRGVVPSASKTVLYGPEGVGKTTLAASTPRPLILDTEGGTRRINCDRVACSDWKSLTLAIAELAVNAQGYQTVVVDSIDWAERQLIDWMLQTSGKSSIEDYGFGKGYVILCEHMAKFLTACDKLVAAGINVVLVAHSKVARVSPPDQADGYDRYELKVSKQTAPVIKEWCDALLFFNFKTRLTTAANGRVKASGGKVRCIYAERCAAWDAKNRFGLPEELPLSIESLEPLFAAGQSAAPASQLFAKASAMIEAAVETDQLDDLAERAKAHATAGRLTVDERDELLDAIREKGLALALGSEPAAIGEAVHGQ